MNSEKRLKNSTVKTFPKRCSIMVNKIDIADLIKDKLESLNTQTGELADKLINLKRRRKDKFHLKNLSLKFKAFTQYETNSDLLKSYTIKNCQIKVSRLSLGKLDKNLKLSSESKAIIKNKFKLKRCSIKLPRVQ
ncbi:unnamed protein product [Brachionus calyciflorus]|uniref:Uncharacterized protein n=1 Tax=Brachionus calyciflorus TaxID=104777 RepID=A0A814HL03_9BILA|nr:unnamed protein product [Brachionus calyciflorus]